jgi:SurA N-terminal domain
MRLCRVMAGLLLCITSLCAAEVVDRIVATVNGHAILESDVDDEIRYESLMSAAEQKPAPTDRKAVLDRLVDRELLNEQSSTVEYVQTTADEIDKALDQTKSDYLNGLKTSWSDALAKYGFNESEVRERIAQELNQLKSIDAHLRPSVQVDQAAIEAYSNGEFLPELRRSNAASLSLQEAAPKIRELLIQQSINAGLAVWLETLHSQAEIRFFPPNSSTADRRQ